MKKYFYLLMTAFLAVAFQSCSKDDDTEEINVLEKNYLSIERGIYKNGPFPTATTGETLNGVDMSNQVMNGAMNFISVVTEQKIEKFFIAIKRVEGYFEYYPTSTGDGGSSEYYTYVIPVMISQSYTGNSTLVLSAQLESGDITAPIENEMFYIETKPGELEIKLGFSNNKDIDLHLYTPSGMHIYYGDRGGVYTNDEGEEITFGLDIDSNANCHIDGINKENIYIPSELVENGVYTVIVDMFSNCDSSIPTSWSVVARYQGKIITPTSGNNPASGTYPSGAGTGDMSTVMTFTINNGNSSTRSSVGNKLNGYSFKPIPLSDMDEMKLIESNFRQTGL